MISEIDAFARLYPWLFSLITLILGLVIGSRLNYWNALELARRKEFIDVVERVVPILEKELTERGPLSKPPESTDLNLIERKIKRRQREGYSKAVLNYKEARKGETQLIEGFMAFEYKDEALIVNAINELLKYLQYR